MKDGLIMVCDVDIGIPDATRTHTVEVARGFAAQGLDVDLVTRGPDPKIEGVRFAQGLGTDDQRGRRIASMNIQAIRLLWRRRRTARRFYIRHRWTIMPALVAAWILRYRVVTQIDDVPYGRGYQREISFVVDYGKRLLAITMGRMAHGIVAVTPEIKGLLVDQFRVPPDRITVLPNGVDVDFFVPLPRSEGILRSGLDPDLRYIVFCGNLASWVDWDTLLGACALVIKARPDARLLLVGDGKERARVEQAVRELGIEHAVKITGFIQNRAQVRDYLAAGTIAVAAHDSSYITRIGVSPTKLAEYLAVGRAIVIKDVPGVREVVEKTGSGIVVPGDPEAMAEGIISLLEPEQADELGARGRRVAEERFAWPSIVRQTVPLFGL